MKNSILNFDHQNKIIQTLILGGVLVLAGAGVVHAESSGKMEPGMPTAGSFDTNSDGSVSQEEATSQGMPANVFKKADSNGDGMLSADEFSQAISPKMDMPGMEMPSSTNKPATEMPAQ